MELKRIKGMEFNQDGRWTCLTSDGNLHTFTRRPRPSYRADVGDVPMLDIEGNFVVFGSEGASNALREMIQYALDQMPSKPAPKSMVLGISPRLPDQPHA